MRKVLSLLAVTLLFFSFCGCSESGAGEPPAPKEPVRIDAGSWPQNEYTESLPQPASVFVTNGWIDETGGYCYVELSGMDRSGFDQYLSTLHDAGFSDAENASTEGTENLLLSSGTLTLSITYTDGQFGMYISKNEKNTDGI